MTRISPKHQQLYRDYYRTRQVATRPNRWLERIEALADRVGAQTILDYGCGAARGISSFSRFPVRDYDPGIIQFACEPEPADLVVSIHMLEHIEPESLSSVLEHMTSLATKALLIVVSCEPSTKELPDGTPWHSLVRDADWWAAATVPPFELQPVLMDRPGAEYAALLVKESK